MSDCTITEAIVGILGFMPEGLVISQVDEGILNRLSDDSTDWLWETNHRFSFACEGCYSGEGAAWVSTDDCGFGRETVSVRIENYEGFCFLADQPES